MSDHKAEAERLTKLAAEIDSNVAATVSVAHATLYLAEQQRIGNLIGLMTSDLTAYDFIIQSETGGYTLKAAIREGLGI